MKPLVIILGASADIGRNICKLYAADGFYVIGTYRTFTEELAELENCERITLFQCDVTLDKDVARFTTFLKKNRFVWTSLFSSVGTSEPIGRFFDIPWEEWKHSIDINCLGQLHMLHALYDLRIKDGVANIALLAGGGTNNPFRCYSAYCVSKLMLIKMCELLDDENPDLNVFIVGPGFVRTKTHLETLRAFDRAGDNYGRVKKFWESGSQGTPIEQIYRCVRWLESKGRHIAGGRNFSVVHDMWGDEALARELLKDSNMYKMRRFRNEWRDRQEDK